MKKIYYIGGSPCSGKSTVAEALSKKYGLYYFKVDDYLEKYLKMGALKKYKTCEKQEKMSSEETWMQDPLLQCEEEFLIYGEMFEFILEDLKQIQHDEIITEGAAFVPSLMNKLNISKDKYISITPTKEFQVFHYSKREWVPYILEGCSDKDQAFKNWMDRDALFAEEVRCQCEELEYESIVNNGDLGIEKIIQQASEWFGLEKISE